MKHKALTATCQLLAALALGLLAACVAKPDATPSVEDLDETADKPNSQQLLEGDSTIYGLACEGCNDSVVVLLPDDNADPVTYNVLEATRRNRVLGRMKVGDWIALVRNPEDTTVADLVLDLDELKGTWCYVVMPHPRGYENMTPAEEARTLAQMPDSVKKQFLIPREYGFTLKRQWTAQSVGYVRQQSALVDKSPVVYPPLGYFMEWHILNGQLVMTSGEFRKQPGTENMTAVPSRMDTCAIELLTADSLVLSSEGMTRGYYRTNKADVNKLARQKAEEQKQKALGN